MIHKMGINNPKGIRTMKDFCFRCGQCCREQRFMFTQEEAKLIENTTAIKLSGEEIRPNRFKMETSCPFLVNNLCSIYEIRPCQCRIYHCGRLQPNGEKIEWISQIQALISNNPEYRRYKERIEKEGIERGNKHGWNWRRRE